MQTTVKSLLTRLVYSFDRAYTSVQRWARKEIVDNDPYDVETLFPSKAEEDSTSLPGR